MIGWNLGYQLFLRTERCPHILWLACVRVSSRLGAEVIQLQRKPKYSVVIVPSIGRSWSFLDEPEIQ